MNQRKSQAQQPREFRIPPWALVVFCLIYDAVLFHIWTEKVMSFPRAVTISLFTIAFAVLTSLFATITNNRKIQTGFALVIVIFWGVMHLVEFGILDSFKNFYTFKQMISGGDNLGQGDFMLATKRLIVGEFWRVPVIALPIVAYFLINKFFPGRGIPNRGMRGWLSSTGAVLLVVALVWGMLISPDRKKFTDLYFFDEVVNGYGLPAAFIRDAIESGNANAGKQLSKDRNSVKEGDARPWEDQINNPTDPDEPEQEVPTGYNVMDIDFYDLIGSTSSDTIKGVHEYVNGQIPSKRNKMTGMFKGKNLILIAAEAFSAEVIDPELTPTLYRMATQGIHFTDFYQPAWGGSTSTGEYSILTGLVPTHGVKSIKDAIGHNMYLTMGNQLMRLGYYSRAYHNGSYTYYDRHLTHENMGYEKFIGMGNGMEEGVRSVWPASDKAMIDFTIPTAIEQGEPFSLYYMTVSGHGLYSWTGNTQSKYNKEAVDHLPYSDTVKAYLACNLELEYAMQDLIQMLDEAGLTNDTVVVICADHYPYCLDKSTTWGNDKDYLAELYGYEADDVFKRDHNALIIWSGCLEGKNIEVTTPTYSLDILPTLSNLFGLDYDSRLLVGRDVFSDQEPLVLWPNYSWKTDKGSYNVSTGTFTPAPGAEVDDDYVDDITTVVRNKIRLSENILYYDYYGVLFGKK